MLTLSCFERLELVTLLQDNNLYASLYAGLELPYRVFQGYNELQRTKAEENGMNYLPHKQSMMTTPQSEKKN